MKHVTVTPAIPIINKITATLPTIALFEQQDFLLVPRPKKKFIIVTKAVL